MVKEEGKTSSYITYFYPPSRRAVAFLISIRTLGQSRHQLLPGLCGGRGCGHDVVPTVAVAPLPLARHVDTIAIDFKTLD